VEIKLPARVKPLNSTDTQTALPTKHDLTADEWGQLSARMKMMARGMSQFHNKCRFIRSQGGIWRDWK
jgi:hypothetical protein